MKNPLLPPITTNQSPQSPRQRIDLKGPRVKHVCRSASVALGQPLATFPSADGKDTESEASGKVVAKASKDEEKSEKRSDEAPKEKENNCQKSNQENVCAISTNANVPTTFGKRTKSHHNILATNHQVVSEKTFPATILKNFLVTHPYLSLLKGPLFTKAEDRRGPHDFYRFLGTIRSRRSWKQGFRSHCF